MMPCCNTCLKEQNFPTPKDAESAGWDVSEIFPSYCPDHASKYDYVFAVLLPKGQVNFGVMEVNNLNEAFARLKDRFPDAKRFNAFCHLGEEQEDSV
jgi:hypothetical protein